MIDVDDAMTRSLNRLAETSKQLVLLLRDPDRELGADGAAEIGRAVASIDKVVLDNLSKVKRAERESAGREIVPFPAMPGID